MISLARTLALAACFAAAAVASAQSPVDGVLPRPVRIERRGDLPFRLNTASAIVVSPEARELRPLAEWLAGEVRRRTGKRLTVTSVAGNSPVIRLDSRYEAANAESYALTADGRGVVLHGASAAGVVWASQTLLQLLDQRPDGWVVDAVRVDDAPRFAWRGSLVDVGRHYLPVRALERHIDLLSRFKMNVMHWHLTEDQGWRLEIKRYPRLTTVGAWRTEQDGSRYGGFYTQAEVRRLVEYARVRGVTIVPEIEMPGHSSAALAAYPELGCTGSKVPVATSWGVFADIYCAGSERTFQFLFGVLDEVMDLFPSPVIHIGGDEAPKDRWKNCAECQALMKREGLKDEEALQSWFMGRIAQYVAKRGRRVIGWDEVLDGPYIADGMVQSWRDSSFTRKALERGHDVVASPGEFTYINRSPGDLTLAGVYKFEPVPPGLPAAVAARLRGGEVTLWSENITSGTNLELMTLPRLLAFADIVWSAAPRDLLALQQRLSDVQLPALRRDGYAVGPADAPLAVMAVRVDSITHRPVLQLPALAVGVTIRATRDGSAPTARSPKVSAGDVLDAPSVVRLQPFWGAERILAERRVAFARHDAVGARVEVSPAPSKQYPGTGASSLVDGLLGSTDHADGLWQGWVAPVVTMTLELKAAARVRSIQARFLQNVRSWILLPVSVEFSCSTDGANWSAPQRVAHDIPITREGAVVHSFEGSCAPGAPVRFVRAVVHTGGPLPVGHPGAGKAAWVFADEFLVSSP